MGVVGLVDDEMIKEGVFEFRDGMREDSAEWLYLGGGELGLGLAERVAEEQIVELRGLEG